MSETDPIGSLGLRTHPEIPDGQMCESCGSLRYHAAYCKHAPPIVRAGVRAAFDLLDIRLRELGVLDDGEMRRYRAKLGEAVGSAASFFQREIASLRQAHAASLVRCDACGFGYSSEHTNANGTYSCPLCDLTAAEKQLAAIRTARDEYVASDGSPDHVLRCLARIDIALRASPNAASAVPNAPPPAGQSR